MEKRLDVLLRITSSLQNRHQGLKIAVAIEIGWRLFAAVTAIEIRTESNMSNGTGKLTDVVDLVDGTFQRGDWFCFAPNQPVLQHNDIHGDAENTIPFDDESNLVVAELTLPVANSSGVLMAGMHPALEMFCDLPERNIREMRHVDRHSERFAVLQQINGIQ